MTLAVSVTRLLRIGPLALLGLVASAPLGCGGPVAPESLGESASALTANDKTAFDYFLGKGLTATQAAGIVGNLDVESGIDPKAVQGGGPGRGIAQWSAGARWDTTAGDNVKSYASTNGADPLSLGLQLDFIWFELTTFPTYGLTKLRAATTVTAAVTAFAGSFEGCGACDTSARISDAQKALAAYGSDAPADGGGGGGTGVTTCVVASTGETGQCISTSACDALGDHVSTPGLCPGAADIQCCTSVLAEGGTAAPDGGGSAAAGGSANSGRNAADKGDSGGGCSTARHGDGADAMLLSLLGVVALAACGGRRRRRGS